MPAGCSVACSRLVYLHAIVVIDGAAAHVGVTLVHGRIDGSTIGGVAGPPALRARDEPLPHPVGDLDRGRERAAVVEDARDRPGRRPHRVASSGCTKIV